MVSLEEFIFDVVKSLVANVIQKSTSLATLRYFEKRKIQSRIEDAIAEVVQPMLPFLEQEKLSEQQQRLLLEVINRELKPLTEDSSMMFVGSLDGQKIFNDLYKERDLPQSIVEESLGDIYSMLFPRIVTLLCHIPIVVKDWESKAWAENYKRLDLFSEEFRRIFHKLDAVEGRLADKEDTTLTLGRRLLAQRVSMELDLTGLRADSPMAGKLDDFFVHPSMLLPGYIVNQTDIDETAVMVGADYITSRDEAIGYFVKSRAYALILGQPGAGKSTWTTWLQREALKSAWLGLAIRMELRQIDHSSPPSISAMVRDHLSVHIAENATATRIQEWTQNGDILIILDGFDEVPSVHRDGLIAWIEEMRQTAGACSIILTSRYLTTDHFIELLKDWDTWHIEPFDKTRILEYIRRWYANVSLLVDLAQDVFPEDIARQITSDPTIEPLTSNPLLLSTLLMVHHLDGNLPSGRAELYRRYVDGMLGLWDARRKVSSVGYDLTLRDKRQILTDIAIHFQTSQQDQIDDTEVIPITRESLKKLGKGLDPVEVLTVLQERSGLLIGPGVYSFIHKSVGEYLVAEAIVQGTSRDSQDNRFDSLHLFAHCSEDKWLVITFLWAGLAPLSDLLSFIDQCLRAYDFKLAYGLILDQYDRFPVETKRQFLLRVLRLEPKLDKQFRDYDQMLMAGISPMDIPICDCNLVGIISPANTMSDFFFRLASDRLLHWKDANGITEPYRELIWIAVVLKSPDFLDWRGCVSSIPETLKSRRNWMFWLASQVCSRELQEDGEAQPNTFLCAYKELYPKQGGYLIRSVIALIRLFKEQLEGNGFGVAERIEALVDLLGRIVSIDVHPETVLHNSEWVDFKSTDSIDFDEPVTKHSFDILSDKFLNLGLDALVEMRENSQIDEIKCHNAEKIISEIIAKMTQLENNNK